MRRLILLSIVVLVVSCSKDEDNSNQYKCYNVLDKEIVHEGNVVIYNLILNGYGAKSVSTAEYEKKKKGDEYCFGGAPNY